MNQQKNQSLSHIRMSVEGIEVLGLIDHRSAGDLQVVIEEPYGYFRNARHLPTIARMSTNYLGPWGDERAHQLLEEIYRFCRFLDMNEDKLRMGLLGIEANFAHDESASRKDRKRKKITNNESVMAHLRRVVPEEWHGFLAQLIEVLHGRTTYRRVIR